MNDTSWLEIDLSGLEANLAAVRRLVGGGVKVCGVVKAGGYGLGAVPIATRLAARGIDMLAVYSPRQGAELVQRGVTCPLLVLMPMRQLTRADPLYRAATSGNLHLTVHDESQIIQLNQAGQLLGCRLPVHLHLDTGMSRSGLDRAQLGRIITSAPALRHVRLAGLYTHFASADDDPAFTADQMDRLDQAVAEHRAALPSDIMVHAANTCGTWRDARFHQSMVRVGLALLGYGPESMRGDPLPQDRPALQPIIRWLTRIVHVQRYAKGEPVGYNRTHTLTRDSVLGVVPVGYGDGYPLSLGNRAYAQVVLSPDDRCATAVLGQVNMDQIVIDLTDAPVAAQRIGTTVELISNDPGSPCALPRLAELAGSSCYEMLCRLSSQLPRRHVGAEQSR